MANIMEILREIIKIVDKREKRKKEDLINEISSIIKIKQKYLKLTLTMLDEMDQDIRICKALKILMKSSCCTKFKREPAAKRKLYIPQKRNCREKLEILEAILSKAQKKYQQFESNLNEETVTSGLRRSKIYKELIEKLKYKSSEKKRKRKMASVKLKQKNIDKIVPESIIEKHKCIAEQKLRPRKIDIIKRKRHRHRNSVIDKLVKTHKMQKRKKRKPKSKVKYTSVTSNKSSINFCKCNIQSGCRSAKKRKIKRKIKVPPSTTKNAIVQPGAPIPRKLHNNFKQNLDGIMTPDFDITHVSKRSVTEEQHLAESSIDGDNQNMETLGSNNAEEKLPAKNISTHALSKNIQTSIEKDN